MKASIVLGLALGAVQISCFAFHSRRAPDEALLSKRQTSGQGKIPTNLVPTIINGGSVAADSLPGLVAAEPKPGTLLKGIIKKRGAISSVINQNHSAAKRQSSTVSPFLSTEFGDQSFCTKYFTVNGPFLSIQGKPSASSLTDLILSDYAGNTTSIIAQIPNEADNGVFTFAPNELLTEMTLYYSTAGDPPGELPYFIGFSFTTTNGNTYNSTATFATTGDQRVAVNIGSGVIGRVRGCQSPDGLIAWMGIDMIDTIASFGISNLDYSGFTNSIAPSGPGNTLVVGDIEINALNSSVTQTGQLITVSATTSEHSLTTDHTFADGGSLSEGIEAKVDFPFIGEASSTSTLEANWQLTDTTSNTATTSSTVTNQATINLACPAGKFCICRASFLIFSLDVSVNATFSLTTTSGGIYSWIQSGHFTASDSSNLNVVVTEFTSTQQ